MDPASLLASARVAHLATADRTGRPHVVPVCFVWLEGVIYTSIDEKPKRSRDPKALRRVKNILENPKVAAVVDHYDEDWSRLAFVIVEGRATLLDAGREHERALAALKDKYLQYADMPIAGRPIIKIQITRTTSWSAR